MQGHWSRQHLPFNVYLKTEIQPCGESCTVCCSASSPNQWSGETPPSAQSSTKRDKADCGNYRGISLPSIAGKITPSIPHCRLQQLIEHVLPETQCGLDFPAEQKTQLFQRDSCRSAESRTDFSILISSLNQSFWQSIKPSFGGSWNAMVAQINSSPVFMTTCRQLSGLTQIPLHFMSQQADIVRDETHGRYQEWRRRWKRFKSTRKQAFEIMEICPESRDTTAQLRPKWRRWINASSILYGGKLVEDLDAKRRHRREAAKQRDNINQAQLLLCVTCDNWLIIWSCLALWLPWGPLATWLRQRMPLKDKPHSKQTHAPQPN